MFVSMFQLTVLWYKHKISIIPFEKKTMQREMWSIWESSYFEEFYDSECEISRLWPFWWAFQDKTLRLFVHFLKQKDQSETKRLNSIQKTERGNDIKKEQNETIPDSSLLLKTRELSLEERRCVWCETRSCRRWRDGRMDLSVDWANGGEDIWESTGEDVEESDESPRRTLRGVNVPPSVGSETVVFELIEFIPVGASDCETERLPEITKKYFTKLSYTQ
jgi:hypothetical protein